MRVAAGLHAYYFERILDGVKVSERRYRQRPDPVLERVTPGDELILYKLGSPEAVSVIVTKVRKRWAVVEGERKLAYFLDFANPSPTTFPVKGRQAGVRVVPEPSR
jgi:hypothetical protein